MLKQPNDILFPTIEARETGLLRVSDLHTIYWEESGNADGIPLVFLHGGPGGPLGPIARQFFDPALYRIVYLHQRGSGQSTPLGETRENTTASLIADIEALRCNRDIRRWVVAAGRGVRRWRSPMPRLIRRPVSGCF